MSAVTFVPAQGEWYVRNGVARRIIESELTERIENEQGYLIWVEREEDPE